jgi:hypothetical protein
MQKWLSFFLLLNFIAVPAKAQTTAPVAVRDPNAVALASRALQSLAGGTALTDITMDGTAIHTAGSDREMGQASLIALGNRQSRVTLNLTSGQRQEIRSGPAGAWVGSDGTAHAAGSSNCHVDAAWFYPALILAAVGRDPSLQIGLIGQDLLAGESVYHLVIYHQFAVPNPKLSPILQTISSMHLYLDTSTLRPVVLNFNWHPATDVTTNIPVEIRYGAYQSFNGVWVPTQIQRYIQYSLDLNLTITSATANSGVPLSAFALPTTSTGGLQ